MNNQKLSIDERARLEELHRYHILDTPAEKDFDDLVKLASQICGTPISLISLVDENRQWFKAKTGISVDGTPRNISFCTHAIEHDEPLVVNDATADNRFNRNPLVLQDPNIRFYAGVPLKSPLGFRLGTLCVIDQKRRELTDEQLAALKTISNQIMNLLDLRLNLKQLKIARNKLAENEMRFRSLADNSPIGIFQTDAEGKGIYVNTKWCEISSISESEALRIGWISAVHRDDRQRVIQAWTRAITAHTNFSSEFRFQNPTKGMRWVKSNASPMYSGQGTVSGYVGTLEDITERKIADQNVKESERKYRLISSNSKDLLTIFEATEEAKCVYVSPSCKEILGYEPEELIGLSPFEMMLENEARDLKQNSLIQLLGGEPVRTECQLRKSDGTFIWVEALSQPIFDEHGTMKTFQSSVRDISERKRLEQQLRAEKDKAEETTQTKSQFLSTMSHEIRTPMNAIIGLTNLMLEENPREDQAESLSLLKFSGENLLALINDILDFNKIEAGKVELENISFNLKDIVQKHINLLKTRATNKGIQLTLTMDESLPAAVSGDPTRLGQILNNLIGNAIKFTDQGAVSVSLSLIKQLGEENQIQFTVQDTGIGIAPDKLDSIFDNFSQASSDTTRKYGGTGLGLSIAQKLAQLMGGHIQVRSNVGSGTTFHFAIGLKTMAGKPMAVSGNHPRSVMTQEVSVLLVEDNKINQVVAGNFIKKWGMKLAIANDGLEGLEMIKTKSYDVVLMDLQMPIMDGYDASQQIRLMDDPYFKTVPIIALSASAMLEEKEKAKEYGFNAFITKPFQPQELRESILQFAPEKTKSADVSPLAEREKKTGNVGLLKRDLAAQNIVHLQELKDSLYHSLEDKNAKVFLNHVTKSKTTLAVLNNAEFNEIISTITDQLNQKQEIKTDVLNNFFIKAEALRKELEAQMEISTAA